MMDKKRAIKYLGIALFLVGIFFLINAPINITGAVIGILDIPSNFSFILGVALIISSLLFIISYNKGEGLENKLKVKNTLLQKRKGGYYIVNTRTGESYSLDEVKEFSQDNETKGELRKEYFSDLLRLYAESQTQEKVKYKIFIEALSPNADPKHLDRRLEQFENVYERFKDRADFMNPERVKKARSNDFSNNEYVRFENERDTLWPEEGSIGFLPFDEVKVSLDRGPLLSIIPIKKLIIDGFLVEERRLNPKWSKQKRQDYLRDTYGIDIGSRERNMIFFQIEKGAEIEKFGNYKNIVVEGKVPLVKVNKKK